MTFLPTIFIKFIFLLSSLKFISDFFVFDQIRICL